MKIPTLFLTLPALAALSLSLRAQDAKNYAYHSSASRQSQQEIEDIGEIVPPDNESDGKSAAPPPAAIKSKFRFNVGTREEFTSNAKLSGDHSSGDLLSLPTIEGGYHTPLGKYFTFDLAAKVESALYADNNDRGFFGYSADATLDYRPAPNLPRIYISAEPYRYDSFDTGDRVTQAVGTLAGTDWGFAFNGGRSLAYTGYTYGHYFADPSVDNRNSHRVVAGVAHQFAQNLTGQLYYSWQLTDFTDVTRHDTRNMVGVNLIYQFTEHLFGNFASAFIDSDSNVERASYQSVTAAVGLTLQF
ncbi:MAG: hypothetical protein QOE70_6250 [Chthoniobacter sp.]|jgi:hypothetical protein|nr:hypothetical protein [Chthoniobacter sp.]